ncbi:hypothetical protein TraAM80_09435, partial [Trypanosoma rangeli]
LVVCIVLQLRPSQQNTKENKIKIKGMMSVNRWVRLFRGARSSLPSLLQERLLSGSGLSGGSYEPPTECRRVEGALQRPRRTLAGSIEDVRNVRVGQINIILLNDFLR